MERSEHIVLAYFCFQRLINHNRYLPRGRSTEIECRTQPQENDVSFVRLSFPDSAFKLNEYRIIAVVALGSMYIREELYMNYGFEYNLPKL